MHDMVVKLVEEHGVNEKEIAQGIGASKGEVEVLLMDGVFKKFNIAEHRYNKAWYGGWFPGSLPMPWKIRVLPGMSFSNWCKGAMGSWSGRPGVWTSRCGASGMCGT